MGTSYSAGVQEYANWETSSFKDPFWNQSKMRPMIAKEFPNALLRAQLKYMAEHCELVERSDSEDSEEGQTPTIVEQCKLAKERVARSKQWQEEYARVSTLPLRTFLTPDFAEDIRRFTLANCYPKEFENLYFGDQNYLFEEIRWKLEREGDFSAKRLEAETVDKLKSVFNKIEMPVRFVFTHVQPTGFFSRWCKSGKDFGYSMISVQVGPYLITWTPKNLVTVEPFQVSAAKVCAMLYPNKEQKFTRDILPKIAELCTLYNRTKTYSSSNDSQEFAMALLAKIGCKSTWMNNPQSPARMLFDSLRNPNWQASDRMVFYDRLQQTDVYLSELNFLKYKFWWEQSQRDPELRMVVVAFYRAYCHRIRAHVFEGSDPEPYLEEWDRIISDNTPGFSTLEISNQCISSM